MCLGIPGRISETYEKDGLRMGKIDFGGTLREACLAYVPNATVGDYVLIHVGFAISQISESEAQETLALLRQIADLEEEIGPAGRT
ncbi:MAG: HypC/HybG/HupF family hydrogenase formation chaperone [Chloroflexi bacterium]|jgi:hydrogenase expression/formation protein HypC|nr:HypC/HybG/HupF family hydrogenase formation chaperone [Chloroflexota bacterium]